MMWKYIYDMRVDKYSFNRTQENNNLRRKKINHQNS